MRLMLNYLVYTEKLTKKLRDRAWLIDSVLIQAKVKFAEMFDGITAGVEQGGIEVSKAFLKVAKANSKSPAVARPSAISH